MKTGRPNEWTEASVREVASEFEGRAAFRKAYPGAYMWAVRNNVLDSVCAHMKRQKTGRSLYTDEQVLAEVKKHDTKQAMMLANLPLYQRMKRTKLDKTNPVIIEHFAAKKKAIKAAKKEQA